jgi:hypothetical protein
LGQNRTLTADFGKGIRTFAKSAVEILFIKKYGIRVRFYLSKNTALECDFIYQKYGFLRHFWQKCFGKSALAKVHFLSKDCI